MEPLFILCLSIALKQNNILIPGVRFAEGRGFMAVHSSSRFRARVGLHVGATLAAAAVVIVIIVSTLPY